MDVNLSVWNVCGLNQCARCSAIHELVMSEKVSLLCLQEEKLDVVNNSLILDMLSLDFDYVALPVVHSCGGILVIWHNDMWIVSCPSFGLNHVMIMVALHSVLGQSWWLTFVYGP